WPNEQHGDGDRRHKNEQQRAVESGEPLVCGDVRAGRPYAARRKWPRSVDRGGNEQDEENAAELAHPSSIADRVCDPSLMPFLTRQSGQRPESCSRVLIAIPAVALRLG